MSYRPLATRYIKTYYKNHHFKTWNLKWFKWMICELRNILKKNRNMSINFACACWDSYQATTCQKSNSDTVEVFQFGSKNPCPHFETSDLRVFKVFVLQFSSLIKWVSTKIQCVSLSGSSLNVGRLLIGSQEHGLARSRWCSHRLTLNITEYLRCFPINLKEEHLRTFTFMYP